MKPLEFNNEEYLERIEFSESNPKEALITGSKWLAFYGSQQGKWARVKQELEEELETAKAIIILRIKSENPKATVAIMDAHFTLDPEVKELKAQLRVATENVFQYKNACVAFTNRGFAANALNSNMREEQKHTISAAYPPSSHTTRTKSEARDALMKSLGVGKDS